ncbi:hypothetical protein CMV_030172 [Castanea mollissima]|uniref:C3H1-type domain-containing protein n=1 Tax=Castanea mollissima TaxID=60419 RepID=A0A8J4Q6R1_9ROSI|nr:hypothetical protein CMV_030172 [Castanea mollissima]
MHHKSSETWYVHLVPCAHRLRTNPGPYIKFFAHALYFHLLQIDVGPTIYPQRPGQIECDFYMKTGECKFGENCKFHHPIDRSAPSLLKQAQQQAVKLTLAGLPRREGAVLCPYYLKTGTCKFGATCKFDHPPPGEVMAMATSQGTSAAVEGDEKEVELLQEQQQ